MKKINKKKAITAVTGVAVLGVAVTALGNASELETLFNPSKFEKFQNQNRTEEYDYMAGEGDNVDLADKDKNSEQNSGNDQDQQALQIKEEKQEENKSADTLGIVNEDKALEQNTDNAKKTGVELDKTSNNNTSNINRTNTSGNKNGTDGSGNNNKNTDSNNNNGNGKNDSNNDNNKDNNTNDNKKDDNSNNNGDNSNDNSGDNNNGDTSTPTPVPSTPTPTPTPIPEELKPRDPYVTEDGQTLKSIHAEITREFYCKGDKFSADDAVVTATFKNSDGSTETKTLSYGGSNGYKVVLSTELTGQQSAVFSYKGATTTAVYRVLNNVVFLNYMAAFDGDDKYYMGAFPGEALQDVIGESAYAVLKDLAGTESCQPVSGNVVDLQEVHRRMIAILGNAQMQNAFLNWTSAGSYKNLMFLTEDSDGYLTNMLKGFSNVKDGALQDSRSYVFYPVTDWGKTGRNVVNIVVNVPDGYKIRRVTENDGDMSQYRGDQVLEKYTGSDKEMSVPMGVTRIALKAKAERVTTLVIPQSVQTLDLDSLCENLPDLTSYETADDLVSLQDYSIRDGMLYSKDGKTLLSVPSGCKEVTIPDTVKYLGEGCLKGLSEDAVVHFEGETPPALKGDTGYKGTILIPDSDYDTVWKNYMFTFGKECKHIVFGSENGEKDLYEYLEDGPILVYKEEQNVLAAIPAGTKGKYTVESPVTAIGAGAFASCDRLTDIVLGEGVTEFRDNSLIVGDNMETLTLTEGGVSVTERIFGDGNVPDMRVYVNKEDYEDYLKSWTEVLDPYYGEGTAAELFVAENDSYVYEDGIKYQAIQSDEGISYKLIRMYQKDRTSCKIKENTVSVNASAFSGCDNLEIVYIPSSVSNMPGDCFANCTSLETVASDNGELFQKEEVKLPENAELMLAGRDFASFIYEDGVLNGTAEDGTHVLLNVVTDYAGQVNIKENTTSYYKRALKGCTQITGIYDPSPLKMQEIGEECFEDCTEITYFDFSDCPNLTTVGAGAFRNCTALTQITFSDSVKTIAQEAFYGCESLKQISMTGVEEIGDRAFYECNSLRITGDIDHLHTLGSQVFYSCRDLRTMALPDDLESMGEGCFENCTELSNVEINSKLISISRYCFYGCKRLVQVTFAEPVTRSASIRMIGVEAFGQCSNLEKIDLSNLTALTQMGEGTFTGCHNLTTVKFPEGFQKLPDNCFDDCTNLSIVQFPGNDIVELGETVFGSTRPTFLHVWVQSDKISEYQTAYGPVLDPVYGEGTTADILGEINDKMEIIQGVMFESTDEGKVLVKASADLEGDYTVPFDTVRIEADAFAGCNKLTQVGIGFSSSVSLGDRCFKGCQNLAYVDIQGSVPEWGEETFMDCPSLAQVYVGATVNGVYTQVDRIGTRAFKNCTALTGDYCMGIRTAVKVLGEECFAGCTNMGAVAVANIFKTSLTTIEDKAFYECSKLRLFLVSTYTSLQSIGDYAFADCDTLAQPSVPKNVTSIGTGCFMNCDNLKYVSFYGSIEEYPQDCFRNCPNLIRTGGTAAAFGGLKRIGANAYAGCTSLQCSTSWNLGRYTILEEIGEGAFSGCTTLTDSSLSETVTFIGAGAFSGCTGINNLVINATEPPVMGSIALDTMSENFNILVPNSEADGDSVYKAYLKSLTDLLGEKDALRILDSVSDGARARYEEELKKLTPTPTPEVAEISETEDTTEEEQENQAELTPTPVPEEENPETSPEPAPAEDAENSGDSDDTKESETSDSTEGSKQENNQETSQNKEDQEENTDTANKENNPS